MSPRAAGSFQSARARHWGEPPSWPALWKWAGLAAVFCRGREAQPRVRVSVKTSCPWHCYTNGLLRLHPSTALLSTLATSKGHFVVLLTYFQTYKNTLYWHMSGHRATAVDTILPPLLSESLPKTDQARGPSLGTPAHLHQCCQLSRLP